MNNNNNNNNNKTLDMNNKSMLCMDSDKGHQEKSKWSTFQNALPNNKKSDPRRSSNSISEYFKQHCLEAKMGIFGTHPEARRGPRRKKIFLELSPQTRSFNYGTIIAETSFDSVTEMVECAADRTRWKKTFVA